MGWSPIWGVGIATTHPCEPPVTSTCFPSYFFEPRAIRMNIGVRASPSITKVAAALPASILERGAWERGGGMEPVADSGGGGEPSCTHQCWRNEQNNLETALAIGLGNLPVGAKRSGQPAVNGRGCVVWRGRDGGFVTDTTEIQTGGHIDLRKGKDAGSTLHHIRVGVKRAAQGDRGSGGAGGA